MVNFSDIRTIVMSSILGTDTTHIISVVAVCRFILYFLLSVLLFKIAIKVIKQFQFGQVVRSDGPESHLKKMGTPTMGGIVFIIVLGLIIFIRTIVLFAISDVLTAHHVNGNEINYIKTLKDMNKIEVYAVIFGLVGFFDDYLKVIKKNPNGLKSRFKFLFQLIIAFIPLFIFNYKVITIPNIPISEVIKFTLIILFNALIVVGTNNGVNFTDGLDGLCACVTVVITIFYMLVSKKYDDAAAFYTNIVFLAMLLAFLIYNHYPAKLFMGDTGSLLLGAYVAYMAIRLRTLYFLPLYGFIYMAEVLSVIIQVTYFKITKGKRFFKMAPIHHHFEKCGMTETQIVAMFTGVTVVLCIITYILIGV